MDSKLIESYANLVSDPPHTPPKVKPIYNLVVGEFVVRHHIEAAIALDQTYYPKELQADVNRVMKWRSVNHLIHTVILDSDGKLAGYITALPLKQIDLEDMLQGKYSDNQLSEFAILDYVNGRSYSLYIASVVIHESHRNGYALKTLYDGFVEFLIQLSERDIYIKEMFAFACTPLGHRLSEGLGGDIFRRTGSETAIYRINMQPPKFRAMTADAVDLYEIMDEHHAAEIKRNPPPDVNLSNIVKLLHFDQVLESWTGRHRSVYISEEESYMIAKSAKEHLLVIYQILSATVGDIQRQLNWLNTYHPEFRAKPIELMKQSVNGLFKVRDYLEKLGKPKQASKRNKSG